MLQLRLDVALRARVDGDREALHARKIVSSVSASHNSDDAASGQLDRESIV